MQLDSDPVVAGQQVLIMVATAITFALVVGKFGLAAWYSPLLVLLTPVSIVAFLAYRARKKRREAGVAK